MWFYAKACDINILFRMKEWAFDYRYLPMLLFPPEPAILKQFVVDCIVVKSDLRYGSVLDNVTRCDKHSFAHVKAGTTADLTIVCRRLNECDAAFVRCKLRT